MDRAFQRSRSLMLRGTFYSVPPTYKTNIYDTSYHADRLVESATQTVTEELFRYFGNTLRILCDEDVQQ